MASQPTAADSVLDALASVTARLGSTRLVAIDGPAGSGKTTVARELEQALREQDVQVATMHLDDVYDGWTGLTPELESRVVTQVLGPLDAGTAARWQRYDWSQERFTNWVDLLVPQVLILEGCGAGARAYAANTSVLAWVEAPRKTRIARGIERDGTEVLSHWLAWMSLEAAHFAANDTKARADLHIFTG